MSRNVTITLPATAIEVLSEGVLTAGSLQAMAPIEARRTAQRYAIRAREHAERAARLGLGCAPPLLRGEVIRLVLYLTPVQVAALGEVAKANPGLGFAQCVAGLVMAGLGQQPNAQEPVRGHATAECGCEWVEKLPSALGLERRPEQLRLTELLVSHLDPGTVSARGAAKVLFAEAATGVGKSFAIAAAAIRAHASSGERVAVSAPTYSVLKDLIRAYQRFESLGPVPPWAVAIGLAEFVSAKRLVGALAAEKRLFASERWIDDGGAEVDGAAELIETDVEQARAWLRAHEDGGGVPHPIYGKLWLLESLQAAAPRFPARQAAALAVDDDKNDPGYMQYLENRARLPEARVIFCTHAMLAIDNRMARGAARRADLGLSGTDWPAAQVEQCDDAEPICPGLLQSARSRAYAASDRLVEQYFASDASAVLPRYRYLIVDEAHLFEQNYASATSEDISLNELRREARALLAPHNLCKPALAKMRRHFLEVVACGKRCEEDVVISGANMQAVPSREDGGSEQYPLLELALRGFAEQCAVIRKALPKLPAEVVGTTEYARLRRRLGDLERILTKPKRSNSYAKVSFSPRYLFPSVALGNKGLTWELDFLWRRQAATALVSATLYLRTRAGGLDSKSHMQVVLGVRTDDAVGMAPIVPAWVRERVHLVVASLARQEGGRLWLEPPSGESRETREARGELWHKECAQVVAQIAAQARSASLVLCTSYETVDALKHYLQDRHPEWAGRLVYMDRRLGFASVQARFTTLALARERPIWLATGQAWTGLNISQPDATVVDDLLSDLVLTRFPYRTNRSSTHAWRIMSNPRYNYDIYDAAMRERQALGRAVRGPNASQKNVWMLDSRVYLPKHAIMRWILSVYPNRSELRRSGVVTHLGFGQADARAA